MAKKKLNIGMVGYGFMGRAHSNAYRRVNNFFDLKLEPVLKAVCARTEERVKPFADQWAASLPVSWLDLRNGARETRLPEAARRVEHAGGHRTRAPRHRHPQRHGDRRRRHRPGQHAGDAGRQRPPGSPPAPWPHRFSGPRLEGRVPRYAHSGALRGLTRTAQRVTAARARLTPGTVSRARQPGPLAQSGNSS